MRWALAITLGTGLLGCASPGWMRLAEHPEKDFQAALKRRLAGAPIGGEHAVELAARRANFVIASAKDESDRAKLEALRPCAKQLGRALRQRARATDAVAAWATLHAMEEGSLPLRVGLGYVTSTDPAWRAVGARALAVAARGNFRDDHRAVSQSDTFAAWWRGRLMRDDDVTVRRAAVAAAAAAASPSDLELLVGTARRDPDEKARERAIEALAAIGTRRAVGALFDIYRNSAEPERLAVVAGWAAMLGTHARNLCSTDRSGATCAAYENLQRVIANDRGHESLRAATALLTTVRGSVSEASRSAEAWFYRRIAKGPTKLRVAAIDKAPLRIASLKKRVVAASKDTDLVVQAAALERLVLLGSASSEPSVQKLRKLAAEQGLASQRAQRALSLLGDEGVVPFLRKAMNDTSSAVRLAAAARFLLLARKNRGPYNAALASLIDKDERIRTRATCLFLNPKWARKQALGPAVVAVATPKASGSSPKGKAAVPKAEEPKAKAAAPKAKGPAPKAKAGLGSLKTVAP